MTPTNPKKEEILRGLSQILEPYELDPFQLRAILNSVSPVIDRLLAADREEVAKEVGKMVRPAPSALLMTKEVRAADLEQNGKSQVDCDAGYNTALIEVLSLLRPQSQSKEDKGE